MKACQTPGCRNDAYVALRAEDRRPIYACLHHYLQVAEAWRERHIRYDATRLVAPQRQRADDPLEEPLREYGHSAAAPQAGRYGYW